MLDTSWAATKNIEVKTSLGEISLAERQWAEPIDIVIEPPHYWLELQLTPRAIKGQACFSERWGAQRFESIGRVYLLPMLQRVRLRSNCRYSCAIGCSFQPAAIERWFEDDLQWTDTRLKQGLDITASPIRNLLFRMSQEIYMPSWGSDALMDLLFAEVIIELARYSVGNEEHADKGGLASWRMRLIKERLAEPGARVSLHELADLCNMSPRQLTRAFRATHGCSIGDYIARDRIDKAKRMLKTDQTLKTIFHALGFNSPAHFYLAFRRATGETPQQYRQRLLSAKRTISLGVE